MRSSECACIRLCVRMRLCVRVNGGPGVAEEGAEPVGVEVGRELGSEEDDEGEVDAVEEALVAGRRARPLPGQVGDGGDLRSVDVEAEVLRRWTREERVNAGRGGRELRWRLGRLTARMRETATD